MKKIYTRIFCLLITAMCSHVMAANSDKLISIENPKINYGVNVGDVLKREVTLELEGNIKSTSLSLPKIGTRVDDIELISVSSAEHKGVTDNKKLTLTLQYQVFNTATEVKSLTLPEETVVLGNGQKHKIPAWKFWFSPLAKTFFLEAKDELKPYATPQLLDYSLYKSIFIACICFMVASILTLTYLNMDLNWIPFIGGPFSKAYSKVRRVKTHADLTGVREVIKELHGAFDTLYDQCFFEKDKKDFYIKHPKYKRLNNELEQFFLLSNRMLFGHSTPDAGDLSKLVSISRSLRDCERGAL